MLIYDTGQLYWLPNDYPLYGGWEEEEDGTRK